MNKMERELRRMFRESELFYGETHITLKDICDRYLVPDKLFELFVTAIHICRLGYTYTGIEKVFN